MGQIQTALARHVLARPRGPRYPRSAVHGSRRYRHAWVLAAPRLPIVFEAAPVVVEELYRGPLPFQRDAISLAERLAERTGVRPGCGSLSTTILPDLLGNDDLA